MNYDDEQYIYFNVSTTSSSVYPVGSNSNRPQIMSFLGPLGYTPLDEYLKILKIGAPEARQLLFQLLKFAFAHFTTNSGPVIATGGHRCVTGHLQVASSRPILKFQKCSKFHENWYSDHFLDEKHDGTIHF